VLRLDRIETLDISPDGKHAVVIYRSAEHFNDVNHLRLLDLGNGSILADFQRPGITIHGGTFVGDHYLFAVASTASPTGSPKSSVKPATSRHPENGQRLAANADHPGLIAWGLESKCRVGPILRVAVTSPRSEDAIVKCFDSPMLSGAFLDRTFGSTSNTLALMRPVCIGLRVHITEGHT